MSKLAFIDTETTGLNRDIHNVWEIGLILRDTDYPGSRGVEYNIQLSQDVINLPFADQTALKINGFYERYKCFNTQFCVAEEQGTPHQVSAYDVALLLARKLDGAHFIAAVPDFDAWFIGKFLKAMGFAPAWHYHLVCIENLMAGHLQQEPPWKSDELSSRFKINRSDYEKHTALGDAIWAKDVYDAVMKNNVQPTT